MDIDVMLVDGAEGRVQGREVHLRASRMKAAVTFPSWSTSPCTLPRGDGCVRQGTRFRWLRARVWDPSSTCRE